MCYTHHMSEQFPTIPSRSVVGGWSVDRYVRLLRPWVMVAGLGAIALVLFRVQQGVITGLQVATCVVVGLLVARRGGRRVEAVAAGAMTGAALGMMTSVSRFVLAPSLYWLVNILFETLLFGLIGAMISAAAQSFLNRKKLST